ncbi:hypothetical protein AURDEDRAFT_130004 [Auricularia subglabra TFB-10046 SS5]|uniref:Uncharacterized protein n=1 Tax=Auricularia subglabra (strain TFB-10046 / SS5) TaxID=717982 RepID=J0CYX1_AURST|nr:hypothetical protein AURDEDRAFT_130004 [Auricularia subglabra TFB-10046 SS5]
MWPRKAYVVGTRNANFNAIAHTLKRAGIEKAVSSVSLDQTLPVFVPPLLIFAACCRNITSMDIATLPMQSLTEDLIRAVGFESLVVFEIHYTLSNDVTPSTLVLLAGMRNLRHLSVRGSEPDGGDASEDFKPPDLPFALESFLWDGGISAEACAHILSQSGQRGALRELVLWVSHSPAALDLVLSSAPAATLRAVSLFIGPYSRRAQRTPYIEVAASFLQRCTGIRDLALQLLHNDVPLALLEDLTLPSRLRTLCLRDPDRKDAAWLAREVESGQNPALGALRMISLEHDAVREGGEARARRAEAMGVLRPVCDARRIRLSARGTTVR